jgi:hypothetical protein
MQREVTLAQVFTWMLALVASVSALSWASLMLLADHEEQAAIFGVGALVLISWSVFHLTDRPSRQR